MRNDAHLGLWGKQVLRVALQGAACLLLALGFIGAQGQSPNPILGATLTPTAPTFTSGAAFTTSATPSITPTLGMVGSSSITATATTTVIPPRTGTPTATPSQTPTILRANTPTSTPAIVSPLQTRVPKPLPGARLLPGQAQVDANTVLLYHFDSQNGKVVTDATGRHDGTLNGNAVIGTGLYAGGLQLDGTGSYVRTGDLGPLSSGTLEAFIDFSTACTTAAMNFSIISAGGEFGGRGDVLTLRVQPGLVFGIFANGQWQWVDSGINPCRYLAGAPVDLPWPYETWRFHHVAGTWGPRGMEIWVDGILHGVGNNDPNAGIQPYPYMCNPQMQAGVDPAPPNDRYPLCKTPVVAPPFPPGDYTGGLPSYSTFLIGCDSSASCFKGRIDELRISNIQRTFTAAVDPTSTPTPTQTPVALSGEYTVDSLTWALFHLSSETQWGQVYDDARQLLVGLAGNATIVSGGRYNNGLALGGNGSLLNMGAPTFTIYNGTVETWIKLSSASAPFGIFSSGGVGPGGNPIWTDMYLGVPSGYANTLSFGFSDSNGNWYWADSGVNASTLVGSWHHVAGTWGWRGMEIWVDGVLRGTNSYTGYPQDRYDSHLVGGDFWGHCMQGMVDEVRVSIVQRSFSPIGTPTPTATPLPWVGPASTVQATLQAAPPTLSPQQQATLDAGLGTTNRSRANASNLAAPTSQALAAAAPVAIPLSTPTANQVRSNIPAPLTPRPTQSQSTNSSVSNARAVSREFRLDSNAIALYHLNSQYGITLSDATGNYPAILFGNATIKNIGGARPALSLDGTLSYAKSNNLAIPRNGTVEAWVNLNATSGSPAILSASHEVNGNYVPSFYLGVRADESNTLSFGLYNRAGWQWADSGIDASAWVGAWHHISGTWGVRGVEIWTDGILRATNPYTGGLPNSRDNTLWIGWEPGSATMNGLLSEIRLSNIQR